MRVRIGCVLLFFAAAAVHAQSFYSTHFERGLTEYQRGQYAAAAQDLRIAAFGFLDSVPEYEMAEIHAVLALQSLQRTREASIEADRILAAERVQAAYDKLQLSPAVRAQFEAALPKLVPAERLRKTPAFARLAAAATPTPQVATVQPAPAPVPPTRSAPTPTPRPAPTPAPQPAPAPRVAPAPAPRTATPGERAVLALQAGDAAQAERLANQAIAADYDDANAHAVLARLAWRAGNWSAAADHDSVVRTRRRLSDDENAEYYAALLRSGRNADAEGLRRLLPASVLSSPVVTEAVAATQPKPKPAPAPTPATQPQPQPRVAPQPARSQPPAPQPKSQPAPAAVPAPQPQSPLVAIAKHQPSDTGAEHDVAAALAEADKLLREGRIASAREAYLKLTLQPAVSRELSLEIAKGLNRTSTFRASSLQYQKLYPLRHGEEMHMLYEAENRYELGDLEAARQILDVALPYLPKSAELDLYRGKIEGKR